MLGPKEKLFFRQLHQAKWHQQVQITPFFSLHKQQIDLLNFSALQQFHLVFYDAFAPGHQPELWTIEVFKKLFYLLQPNAALVTYCAKGDVRRAMITAGFTIDRLPGPPGKREMLRAIRPAIQ